MKLTARLTMFVNKKKMLPKIYTVIYSVLVSSLIIMSKGHSHLEKLYNFYYHYFREYITWMFLAVTCILNEF